MDPVRIEAYLRSTCSVLDFDIGELWCAKKTEGNNMNLKFLQLYTSPTYEDFHSLLIQPDRSPDVRSQDEGKHQFSPIICHSVCDGGQIVWANTRTSEGLTGRTEMPLNTAVGVPICSLGSELYLLVLFAVRLNQMTPDAVEYLVSVVRAVTMSTGGFLPASLCGPVTAPETSEFVGLWDIAELIRKYTNDVDFKLLPICRIQHYFDCHEILLFCDLFHDYKLTRNGTFTTKQLDSLKDTYKAVTNSSFSGRGRSGSMDSQSSRNWQENDLEYKHSQDRELEDGSEYAYPSYDSERGENVATGVYCADISDMSYNVDMNELSKMTMSHSSHRSAQNDTVSAGTGVDRSPFQGTITSDSNTNRTSHPGKVLAILRQVSEEQPTVDDTILHIYAHMNYKLNQCRYHEFMIAVLGMTVFDSGELWLQTESGTELYLMAAVYRTRTMQQWTSLSETVRLGSGYDVPGRIVETEHYCWEPHYCLPSQHSSPATPLTHSPAPTEDGRFRAGPRVRLAQELGIRTAFGVPVPGLRRTCGAMVFYSSRCLDPDPLMVELIQKAVSIMAQTGQPMDQETVDQSGDPKMLKWLHDDDDCQQATLHRRLERLEKGAASHVLPDSSIDLNRRMQIAQSIVKGRKAVVKGPDVTSSFEGGLLNSIVHYNRKHRGVEGETEESMGMGSNVMGLELLSSQEVLQQMRNMEAQGVLAEAPRPMPRRPSSVSILELPTHVGTGSAGSGSQGWGPEDAMENAAIALANFGRFHWVAFLEGDCPPVSPTGGGGFGGNGFGFGEQGDQEEQKAQIEPQRKRAPPHVPGSYAYGDAKRSKTGTEWAGGNGVGGVNTNGARKGGGGASKGGNGASSSSGVGDGGEGGFKKCRVDFCTAEVDHPDSSWCPQHRSTRRCHHEGCGKCAQGATKFCISHGGGRRCTYAGCFKGARDKFFCAAHGGGKRCTYTGCSKSAVGGSQLCTAHGGGKRCKFDGCNKSSQSCTDFCVKHGGGRSCQFRNCTKVARGKTEYCAAHGGGVRCRSKGCHKVAVGATYFCRGHTEGEGDGGDEEEDDDFVGEEEEEEEEEEEGGQDGSVSSLLAMQNIS